MRRFARMPCRPGALAAILPLAASILVSACGDSPTQLRPPPPPPDPDRAALLAEVRQLAESRSLDPVPVPDPVRGPLVELGRMLAFDKILSGNRDISCMTCHLPAFGTGDGKSLSVGQGATGLGPERAHPSGTFIPRNSPTMMNLHLARTLFWDGRLETLPDGSFRTPAGSDLTPEMEAVFEFGALSALPLFPVLDRDEMRAVQGNELATIPDADPQQVWAALMARLGAIPEYVQMFEAAYPGTAFADMTFAHASNAIAGFMVSELAFVDTPWDRFLAGNDNELTNEQLRGARSFMTFGCVFCHEADTFDDGEFHNAATPQIGPGKGDGPGANDDFGRERVTGAVADRRRFRTPMLRNVELTAPYGHAGQFATLEAIVNHYDDIVTRFSDYDVTQVEAALQPTMLNNVAEVLASLDPLLPDRTFASPGEGDDIVAFLHSLTDDAARSLSSITPPRVPSGLSIDR